MSEATNSEFRYYAETRFPAAADGPTLYRSRIVNGAAQDHVWNGYGWRTTMILISYRSNRGDFDLREITGQSADALASPTGDNTAAWKATDACTCVRVCRECDLSGVWHVHVGKWCPVHPDARSDETLLDTWW